MKIKDLEAIPLHYPLQPDGYYGNARGLVQARTCTLIKLTTESGVEGVGEAFGPPKVIVEMVNDLKHNFIGQEPFDIPNLIAKLMNALYHSASKGLVVCALSGVELAGWDLAGKITRLPVYKLLGGLSRSKFLPYGSTGYITADSSEDKLRRQVEQVVNLGLKAIKIKIGTNIEEDIQRVKLVREYSDSLKIMVDMNGNYTADLAVRSIKAIESYDLYWVEEPVPPYDYEGFKKIKQTCGYISIATGEAEYTRYGFKEIIQKQIVDIVQPDLCKCGGLNEAKAISIMAQVNNIRISPHIWGGAVGKAAASHFMASIPYYPHSLEEPEPMMFEYDLGGNALRDELGTVPVTLKEGWLEIQDKPGLGVELDMEKVNFHRMN